jgi:hypothetical protein
MIARIVPFQLDTGQEILVEVAEGSCDEGPQPASVVDKARGQIGAVDTTIREFARVVLQAVSELEHDGHRPDKVSLEFALKFVGEAAIPAIAKGSAEAGVTVSIQWLPD